MPLITEYIPPDHWTTESGITFETYRFYLQCICDFLIIEYQDWQTFAEQAASSTRRIRGIRDLDMKWIRQYLKIAWNTEFLVLMDIDDTEVTRISNQWLPVQAYYAVYSAAEALAHAIDRAKSFSHRKTMRKVSDFLIKQRLQPWDKAYRGAIGRGGNDHIPINFPAGFTPPHNLKRFDVDPLSMTGTCLRAEHKKRVDDLWRSKKESKSYKYQFNPGDTTLLHFLYRLRIRCNYQDIDPFLSSAPDHHITSFAQCLRDITSWTLTLIEILLMRRCRKKPIIDLARDYLTINSRASTLKKRFDAYSGIVT